MTQFKFSNWIPKTDPIPENKKPIDVCAPVADKDRFVPLNKRNMDMLERRGDEIRKIMQASAEKNKNNKIKHEDIPEVIMVPMGKMMIVTDQQREPEEDHIIYDIMVPWDSRFFTTPRGAWDPIQKMYGITEGQQRILAFRDRIRMGLVKGIKPNDWEKVELPVQIVKLEIKDGVVDYGPERRVFNIENGEKLPVSQIDKFKNEVHGKNMDSPNAQTYEEFEQAALVYADMIKAGITPTASEGKNANKPGAFKHINYVRSDTKGKGNKAKLSRTQLKRIYKRHNAYSMHEPVIAIELLPILKLDEEIENFSWYSKDDAKKVDEAEKFRKYLNATVHSVWHGWDAYMKFAQQVWNRRCTKLQKKEQTPADWSLALLIQLVKKAGYTFPGIDKAWYSKYDQPSGWDCLTNEEQQLFL